MKQTVAILSALILSLLTVTGFILHTSFEQNQLIAKLRAEQDALALEALQSKRELQQALEQRDALSQKLIDAVLSSQEANDAVAFQQSRAQALEEALAAARLETQTLRQALENAPTEKDSVY